METDAALQTPDVFAEAKNDAFAFGAPMAAFSVTQKKTDQGFAFLFRLIITPLGFFSGTYFPIENLPFAAQVLSWCTPTCTRCCPQPLVGAGDPGHLRLVPCRRSAALGNRRHGCRDLLLP